jgi:hypothetical protein
MPKAPIFDDPKQSCMRLRLFSVAILVLAFTACKKEVDRTSILYKRFIPMDFSQVAPVAGAPIFPPSPAAGNFDFFYNSTTRQITYTIRWNTLSSAPTSVTINGPAAVGFNGNTIQAVSGVAAATAGSVSGSLLVDNLTVREQDLLQGLFYVTIRTTFYPLGEIRGQAVLK